MSNELQYDAFGNPILTADIGELNKKRNVRTAQEQFRTISNTNYERGELEVYKQKYDRFGNPILPVNIYEINDKGKAKIAQEIYRIVTIKGESKKLFYTKSKIPKGARKFRCIYIPNDEYKKLLYSYMPYLLDVFKKHERLKLNHAFLNNRNCVTNASMHIGYQYCLSFDIKDFFDNIKKEHLSWAIEESILDLFLIDGSPRQGLPTSPILSNIAFIKIDDEIYRDIVSPYNIIYSRYADDLYFSFNDLNFKKVIIRKLKKIINNYSFEFNDKKYTFQKRRNGNIIVTGISVSENGIRPTRRTIKKIRAANHRLLKMIEHYSQKNNMDNTKILVQKRKINGLISWAQCRLPKKNSKNRSKKCQ